jgi:hypothetical protein
MTKLSPAARLVLEEALHEEEPTAVDRTRVRSQLAARIAQGAVAGAVVASTSAAAASAKLAGLAKLLGLLALLGTVSVALSGAPSDPPLEIARAAQPQQPQLDTQNASGGEKLPAQREARPAIDPIERPFAQRDVAPQSPTEARPPSGQGEARPASRVQPTTRTGAPATQTAPAAGDASDAQPQELDALKAETALIKKAHLALRAGEAERALSLLDRHAREHPRGQLGEEREAARVLALCRLGRKDEARRAAGRFLAERSPLAERIKSACGF